MRGINLYRVKDCSDDVLRGSFYEQEMIKVVGDPNALHRIENILEEKTENGITKVLVQWQGSPRACAQWINKSDLRDI